jgi:hypothetical protein
MAQVSNFYDVVNRICVRVQTELEKRGIRFVAKAAPLKPAAVKNIHVLQPMETDVEDKVVGKLVAELSFYKGFTCYPSEVPKGSVEDGAMMAYRGLVLRGLLAYDMTSARYLMRIDVYYTEGISDDDKQLLAERDRNPGGISTGPSDMGEAGPTPPQ